MQSVQCEAKRRHFDDVADREGAFGQIIIEVCYGLKHVEESSRNLLLVRFDSRLKVRTAFRGANPQSEETFEDVQVAQLNNSGTACTT